MKKTILICSHCFKIKKFGEFVLAPATVLMAIADKEVTLQNILCPACQGKTKLGFFSP